MEVDVLRYVLVAAGFALLGWIGLRENQVKRWNWSAFYSTLYVLVSLPVVNVLCVNLGFWEFLGASNSLIKQPIDLYFVWVVIWGIIPVFFIDKPYFPIIFIGLFWLDLLLMPQLEAVGWLSLGEYWMVGEGLLLIFVLVPAYLWAYASYWNRWLWVRAILQILTMCILFVFGLPFILCSYELGPVPSLELDPIGLQLMLIAVFPALAAVNDLVKIGKGTPFPYDKTNVLVRTGVYAYCKNPIQWSFAMMFLPLSYYHGNPWLLLGLPISIAYAIGVSDVQEYPDLIDRFGINYEKYKGKVPKWYFSWKPLDMPKGTIYFDRDCEECDGFRTKFLGMDTSNLEVRSATEYVGDALMQATYVDNNGEEFKSVAALAKALEHVNLVFACLGWFMRMPGVNYVLQLIVDAVGFGDRSTYLRAKL